MKTRNSFLKSWLPADSATNGWTSKWVTTKWNQRLKGLSKIEMSRSNQQPTSERCITDRHKLLGFGKYAHETVQDILDNDPGYFIWLDANTDIQITSDILAEADENSHPNHEFKGYTKRDITNAVGSLNDFIGDD